MIEASTCAPHPRRHGTLIPTMTWIEPQYSSRAVNRAGRALIRYAHSDEVLTQPLGVIDNWRASHAFPLNTFQVYLRRQARQIDNSCLVAQRVKRLSSIDLKLRRFNWLVLSEMQDIAGCRAVVSSVTRVNRLVGVYKNSSLKHQLIREDDYITNPKTSGYRSYHLIYKYNSDKKETYNGLKVEIQLRSNLQHAWATAVETVGTFIRQALKSSQGEEEWLRFFALMGTEIALREGSPPVPDTPTGKTQLARELKDYAKSLDVESRLETYRTTLEVLRQPPPAFVRARFFLLKLEERQITITSYGLQQLELASAAYLQAEREMSKRPGADVVLVSVDSIAALRRAYPNYFADTRTFLRALRRAINSD